MKGKRVLVVGLGASGLAAARLCLDRGARVRATDAGGDPPAARELFTAGAELILGAHRREDFLWAELVVLSPGVDPALPEVAAARDSGAEVIGELELGWRCLEAPSLMITGTNGKSTVTTLAGRMLALAGMRVFVGGNLGTPLCELINRGDAVDWAVLEVSSFQLETAPTIRPEVGVLLNLTPDHIDRHRDFAAYAKAKFHLFANQRPQDLAILCLDDPNVAAGRDFCPGRVWGYSGWGPCRPGGSLDGDTLVISDDAGRRLTLDASVSPLEGGFNRLNLLAAACAAHACGADPHAIQGALQMFRGLPHRLQKVGAAAGVDWLDDSKATNVGAVIAALESLDRPVVLLLGGRDKEGGFKDLAPHLQAHVTQAVCFGEAGPAIHEQIQAAVASQVVPDLQAAVAAAREAALPGEAVLLSPGCASFDAYSGYAQRGDHFQALVREVIGD